MEEFLWQGHIIQDNENSIMMWIWENFEKIMTKVFIRVEPSFAEQTMLKITIFRQIYSKIIFPKLNSTPKGKVSRLIFDNQWDINLYLIHSLPLNTKVIPPSFCINRNLSSSLLSQYESDGKFVQLTSLGWNFRYWKTDTKTWKKKLSLMTINSLLFSFMQFQISQRLNYAFMYPYE